jgi:hypothetical protein
MLGVLAVPGAAWAAGAPMTVVDVDGGSDEAASDRFFVEWLSIEDPRSEVRSAARIALESNDAAVITEFLNVGWDAAIALAAQNRARYRDFATRMVDTHSAESYPRVNAAGLRALAGTAEQLEEFALTGYAKALERDLKDLKDDEDQAAKILQENRDYVTKLSLDDPGAEVRAWADRRALAAETRMNKPVG